MIDLLIGLYLQYASEKLKADPELVKIAVAHNGYALQFAAETVKADPEVVKIAVAQQGWALGYAADSLKADPEVVQRDEQPTIFEAFNFLLKKLFTPLDLCVSSCWGAHATPFVCVLPKTKSDNHMYSWGGECRQLGPEGGASL